MRNAGKRFENLKFRKKLILVFGLSLIFSLTLSLFMLASYFISVLRQNARSNLRLLTLQVTDNFESRLSDTESQLFNMINMFQIPSYMGRMDSQRDSYGRRELTYMANQLVSAVSPFDFIYLETDGKRVNAKSIMGMMTLGLAAGGMIKVEADGTDEEQAVAQIEKYLTNQ